MRNWFRIILFVLLIPTRVNSQIISTVAGGGSGDNENVPATSIDLGLLKSIACDTSGNIFVANGPSHRIRRIDENGYIQTIAGTGSAGFDGDGGIALAAKFNMPTWICLDASANIYVSDNLNNRIRKVDRSTTVGSTVIGNDSCSFTGDGGLATSASLCNPHGHAFDLFGNFYFVDNVNSRIRKITVAGTVTTVAGNGQVGFSGDGGPATLASFDGPTGVCVDSNGNIFIADGNSRIRRVDATTNIITTIAGNGIPTYNGDNIPAILSQLHPWSLAFDKNGNLFVSDHNNHRIRMIDAAGYIHTVAGNGIQGFSGDGNDAISANLSFPEGMAFDHCGNLLIADNQNSRIRKISFNPHCWPTYISEVRPLSFSFYPNPASDEINIRSESKLKNLVVVNAIGQRVMEKSIAGETARLSISHLQAGVYFITVTDANGARQAKKIVKE